VDCRDSRAPARRAARPDPPKTTNRFCAPWSASRLRSG